VPAAHLYVGCDAKKLQGEAAAAAAGRCLGVQWRPDGILLVGVCPFGLRGVPAAHVTQARLQCCSLV
jgi:hypothetical protein